MEYDNQDNDEPEPEPIKENPDYLTVEDIERPFKDHKYVLIESNMGSGKTTAVNEYIRQLRE